MCTIQCTQIKITTAMAAINETLLAFVGYFVKYPELFHQIITLVPFPDTFLRICLMDLPVMAPDLLLVEILS